MLGEHSLKSNITLTTTKFYKATAIGDFGDSWQVKSGSKVEAVHNQHSPVLYIPSPESPFEIAVAMRSNTGTPEQPGIVFDPVRFILNREADTPEEFEMLFSKDSNRNDWALDVFNPIQIILYDHTIKIAQSFKFARQPMPIQTWKILKVGFRVWAKISKDPIGRKVMVVELKKVLQYVA